MAFLLLHNYTDFITNSVNMMIINILTISADNVFVKVNF